jgi:hypothetical protein
VTSMATRCGYRPGDGTERTDMALLLSDVFVNGYMLAVGANTHLYKR